MKDMLKWVVLGGLFLLPLLPLLVTDSLFFPYVTGKNFAFRIIVEITVAAWVLLALLDSAYRPRLSWLLGSFAAFTGIVLLADLAGVVPEKSLWSNFERMDGFVTVAHLFGYFLVAGSVLTSVALWRRFFQVSLAVASCVALYAFAQLAGFFDIQQGGLRIDATLGNAIYMAIYMFFSIGLALYLLVTEESTRLRYLYGALAAVFTFLLFATATRGTILGFGAGIFVAAAYAAYALRDDRRVRVLALGALAALVLAAGTLYAARDTDFVRNQPLLERIASISLSEGSTRFTIWGLALEGFKERPLLGWGQENFNYVFSKYYDPSLYAQEPWFDRVHNVYLDWLIAAGALGLAAYLALWLSALRYLVLPVGGRDENKNREESFTPAERAVLLGLLAGYAVHGLFIFHNLIGLLFFVTLLAFVHVRTSRSEPLFATLRVRETTVLYAALPVAAFLIFVIYTVNVPGIQAAQDLIRTLGYTQALESGQLSPTQSQTALARLESTFEEAYARDSFATQEISEQLALAAQRVYFSRTLSQEAKDAFAAYAIERFSGFAEERPNDARVHYFLGTLLGVTGSFERASMEFRIALENSPQKQQIMLDAGATALDAGRIDEAGELIERAFALNEQSDQARAYAIIAAIYRNDGARVAELASSPHERVYLYTDQILQAYYRLGYYQEALNIVEARLAENSNDLSIIVSRAQIQYQLGAQGAAIATIREAIERFPGFAQQGGEIITEFQQGL